jgi:Na+/H+-dicarboxylate symporter
LQVAILLGLVAGLLLGLAAAVTQSPTLNGLTEGVEPIGAAFVNLLRMVVIPLVAAVIFVGVASLGDLRRLGRMGSATLAFFAVTSVIGVLLGLAVMRALLPLASEAAAQAITAGTVEAPTLPGPVEFLLSLIPTLVGFAKAIAAALIKLTHWILWIAPIGVFALAAPVTARAGWALLQSLIAFVIAVLVALLIFVAVIYMPAVRFLARMSAGKFLKACVSPQVIAAATVSSPATVPAMLEAADDELGVSSTVSGFVIPLGAGIGRAGSAVFQGAGLAFLAWLYGVPLPVSGIGGVVLATVIVSFTVPSIPGGSVLSMAPALGTVGIPLDGLAVLLGVDRIPDMARTATNVTGTLVATVVVDRLEERSQPL